MKERSLLQYLMLSVRGVGMGAADVVPGVSGGTIAFITGIYEELIESLNNINLGAVKILFKDGIKAFWKHINGTFFFFLFGGIIVSVVLLAEVVGGLLETQPVILWSFFFGGTFILLFLIIPPVRISPGRGFFVSTLFKQTKRFLLESCGFLEH